MAKINVRDRNKNNPDKKPNWEYRFEAAKVEGKRKHISKSGFRTKKDALEAGTKALAEYNSSGLHFEPTEISVSDYLDYWFDQYCKTNLKYNTQLGYLSIIENHLKPRLGSYKLKALNSSILQDYANDLKLNGYSKSHVVGILSTLSGALDYAIKPLCYIQQNPMRLVKFPKIDREPKQRIILTMEEWETIIGKFQPPSRYYIPLMIGFHTGLRISEAFALTWDDIDLEKNELSVNKQVVKRNFGVEVRRTMKVKGKKEQRSSWYFQSTKTKSSVRTVKFGETLAEALKAEKARQAKNELMYGAFYNIHVLKTEIDEKGNKMQRIMPLQKCIETTYPRARLVCIAENGEYTSTDSFKYAARIIHHDLKLAFDYHSLRHTHATLLIEHGANIKNVQKRLGHEKIETTLQTYVHDTEKMTEQSVDIFESILKSVSNK